MELDLYFYSSSAIAPAISVDAEGKRSATEPDYTGIITPMQLRRMSKAVRLGIYTGKKCLEQAGVERPDAIVVGTAMGCLHDTEFFLGKMISQDEQMLTPTSFIQSTHNTVSGQIALLLGCNGHNLTFVQRGHSFAHALLDAHLYLTDHPEHTVLVGGLDELSPGSQKVWEAFRVNDRSQNSTAAAEGAAFFLVGKRPQKGAWRLRDLEFPTVRKEEEAFEIIENFIQKDEKDSIQKHYTGYPLSKIQQQEKPLLFYKEQTGNYATADALALSLLMEEHLSTSLLKLSKSEMHQKALISAAFMDQLSLYKFEMPVVK